MTPSNKKLAVAGAVLVAAIAYLATAGVRSGWVYYVHVDGISAEHLSGVQRVRIHGKVAEEHFLARPAMLTAHFDLAGQTRRVPVDYRGPIPDLFKAGCDAVVEGRFDPATGVFKADVLMTKCASKYEESAPHASNEGGSR